MFWLFEWLFCWLYLHASRKAELSLMLFWHFVWLYRFVFIDPEEADQAKILSQFFPVERWFGATFWEKKSSFQRSRAHLLPVDFSSLTPWKVRSLWDMSASVESIYTLERQAEWSASEGAEQERKNTQRIVHYFKLQIPPNPSMCEWSNSKQQLSQQLLSADDDVKRWRTVLFPHSAAEVWSGWFHSIVLSSQENSSNYCSVLDKLFSTRNNIYRCLTEWSIHTLIWSLWIMTV